MINADDYYGPEAFQKIYDYLLGQPGPGTGKYEYAMVGYLLENTVTENGHVARGICVTNAEGYSGRVTERTHIEKTAAARASRRMTAPLDGPARRTPSYP